jgi:hypothetical protein
MLIFSFLLEPFYGMVGRLEFFLRSRNLHFFFTDFGRFLIGGDFTWGTFFSISSSFLAGFWSFFLDTDFEIGFSPFVFVGFGMLFYDFEIWIEFL